MEKNGNILWADDEIDLLKPHILFLKQKGYEVETVNNGNDALEAAKHKRYDVIILDENMPGLSGLETLSQIKQLQPDVPVIMITKSEEASDYQQEFRRITEQINESYDINDWYDLYRKLVFWEMELAQTETNMDELLLMQKNEANSAFCKFIRKNYESWMTSENHPIMSNEIFKKKVFPLLDNGDKVFFILIDNFRLDQWRIIKPLLSDYFSTEEELYCSILPTATQYARNAIFSGLMPLQIEKMFPDLWVDEDSEEGKNINESPLIQTQFERYRKRYKFSYHKVYESAYGEKILQNFSSLETNDLNVIVFNFIDMLSHARTESKMIRELASNNAAYRSLTESWFRHSSASDLLRKIAESGYKVILTTDHGTIRVDNPIKVIGDKNTNTNLRYKVGKNLSYNNRQVYEIRRPDRFGLPSPNLSSAYIFAMNGDFFTYPNNYNYYVQYYKDTFQHGGISMEEMLVPIITMQPK